MQVQQTLPAANKLWAGNLCFTFSGKVRVCGERIGREAHVTKHRPLSNIDLAMHEFYVSHVSHLLTLIVVISVCRLYIV